MGDSKPEDRTLNKKYERPALQARSLQTQEAIKAAFARLLDHRPIEAITIADVAREAKVGVGTVYGRFKDKDSIILSLYQIFYDESDSMYANLVKNHFDMPLIDRWHAATEVMFATMYNHRAFIRSMWRDALHQIGSPLYVEMVDTFTKWHRRWVKLLWQDGKDWPSHMTRADYDVCIRVTVATVRELVLTSNIATNDFSEGELREQLEILKNIQVKMLS